MHPIIERIKRAFGRANSCTNCAMTTNEDPLANKTFKCAKDGKLYRYVCAASPDKKRNNLVVVYQDIESGLFYTDKWNDFFSTSNKKGNCIPRFEEQ